MKKRLFAGALALLMIIGLLPVSSMLKKPVEAQAASTTKSYEVTDFKNNVSVNNCIGDSQDNSFFKVGVKEITISSSKIRFASTGEISFDVKGEEADIELKWEVPRNADNKIYVNIIDAATNEVVATSAHSGGRSEVYTVKYKITKKGTYIIKNVGDKSIYVSGLKVTVPAYTININDSKASEISKKVVVGEGENIPLNAAEGNFLYWETSYRRIASREPNPSTPLTAYYDETYTAVYGSDVTVYYMTAYDQIYKSVSLDAFNSSPDQPAGPIRYGYKFKRWSKSASEIKDDIESGTTNKIFVEPYYDSVITTKYTVTVNKKALTDDGVSVVTEYGFNEVATASTSSTEFAYWRDGKTGKVLSYNSTYYFFVNDNIEVVAVNKSEASYEAKPVISVVYNGTNDDGDSIVIFEYTVPSDYTVKFAGVYASPNSNNLKEELAEFVDGGVFNSKNTYKYTVTKTKEMGTWYVKPILKYEYTDSTGKIQTESITLEYETF